MNDNELQVRIVGTNELDPALRAAEASIGKFGSQATVSAKEFQAAMAAAGGSVEKAAGNILGASSQISSAAQHMGSSYVEQSKRAKEALGSFYDTLERSGTVSKRSVGQAIVQHELLRQEIIRTWGALDRATPQVIADYNRIGEEIRRVKGQARELTDAVQDQVGELDEAGVRWRGLGDTLSNVAGKHGAVVAKAGVAVIALREVHAILRSIGEATGLDYSGLNAFLDDAKMKGRELWTVLGDVQAVLWSISTFDPQGVRNAVMSGEGLLDPIAAGSANRGKQVVSQEWLDWAAGAEGDADQERLRKLADAFGKLTLQLDLQAAGYAKNSAEVHRLNLEMIDAQAIALKNQGYDEVQIAYLISKQKHVERLRYETERLKNVELTYGEIIGKRVPYLLDSVDPRINQETLDRARAQANPTLAIVDPVIHEITLAIAKAGAAAGEAHASALTVRMRDQKYVDTLSDVFADAAMTGGKNFGEIAARTFNEVVTAGADAIMGAIFGKRGDPALGQDPNLYYGANGKPLSDRQMQYAGVARAGLTYGTVAYSGYQGGRSGADNAQTSGLVSGATAGATFGVYGAIIGAMIGWGSAYIGRLRAKDDEKWAVPSIDANGNVTVDRPSTTRRLGSERYPGTIPWLIGRARTGGSGEREVPNTVTDAEVEDMVKSITETYNTFKDAYVKILLSIPNAVITQIGRIDGQFQDAPSKDFLENFERWVSGTLPDQIAEQFREGMESAYVSMGLSVEKFNELWKEFDALDPDKAVTLWATLASALRDFQTAGEFFRQSDPMGLSGGSGTFQREMIRLQADSRSSYGQRISTFDDEILRFAAGIEHLSLEGQIDALGELGRMQMQRYQMEKEAIQEIFDILMGAKAQLTADLDDLAVMGMVNADGSPDHYGIAGYWQGRADDALGNLGSATTADQAREEYENFRRFVMSAGNAGLAQAQTPEERQQWIEWMREQLGAGYSVLETTLGRLGEEINEVNDIFAEEVQPVIDALTTAIGDVDTGLGDLGETVGDVIIPLQEFEKSIIAVTGALNGIGGGDGEKMGVVLPFTGARFEQTSADMATFAATIASTGQPLQDLTSNVEALSGAVVSLQSRIDSLSFDSTSEFSERTIASRKF
jgi:hypothetical protein